MRKVLNILAIYLLITTHAFSKDKVDSVKIDIESIYSDYIESGKKQATYFLKIKTDSTEKEVTAKIDVQTVTYNVPEPVTIPPLKELIALSTQLKREADTKKEEFDVKLGQYILGVKERKRIQSELMAIDTSETEKIKEKTSQLESKKAENAKLITEFNSVFSEYEQIISKVKGATQKELKNSFDAIIKEEYAKLLSGDKEFDQTIIDNAILFDIEVKVMLLKIKRDKMISYTKRGGKEVEEEITSEQTYHLLHFTEFGAKYYWGDNEQKIVKKLILECKTEEAKRGINFLSSEPYTIVTDNKNLAQHYINKIVHYRTYVEVEEEKYKITLRDDDDEIEAGAYLLITAEPEMPAISVEAESESTSEIEVKLRLKIEYRRDIRQDEDYFPENGWYETTLNKEWEVDFGDRIRGGKATLYTKVGESRDTIIFHIRGTNPTEQSIKKYIEKKKYDNIWFFTRLIRQESTFMHFNNGTNYGPEWSNSVGCPNWGAPHGWGLSQLDLLSGGQRPTAQELWNWKANVDRGYAFINGEKFIIAEDHIEGEMKVINIWNRENPTDPVEGHDDQEEGNNVNSITYTHASSDSFDFDWGNLDADSKSFLDAVWIKSYNGNSEGYYYRLISPRQKYEKPQWELVRINIHNHNYVRAVSGQIE